MAMQILETLDLFLRRRAINENTWYDVEGSISAFRPRLANGVTQLRKKS